MPEPYVVQALSPRRKIIAARMAEATRTIPHFRVVADIEVDAIADALKYLREQDASAPLSLNDLLIKACALSLMEVPALNVQFVDGEVRQYRTADISVVTALPDGLSTPIVRGAESKTVWLVAREVRELAARAKSNALKMDEVFGGSFCISNLGMYGVDQFDAIINPPQCAILAVGRTRPSCLASREGTVRVASVLTATLSIDHRVVDGATAAAFMGAFRQHVEQPRHLQSTAS